MPNKQVQVEKTEILSDDWYVLKKTTFTYHRADGPTTEAMAQPYCCTTLNAERSY